MDAEMAEASFLSRLAQVAAGAAAALESNPQALSTELFALAQEAATVAAEVKGRAVAGEGESHAAPPPSTSSAPLQPAKRPRKGAATATATAAATPAADGAAQKPPRAFDFGKFRSRHVALEVMYVGGRFHGFARQDTTDNTIEGHIFSAMRKIRLIPDDPAAISSLSYSRCGRTDKGVSALGQVIALQLRSAAKVDEPELNLDQEYDYPRLLNKALPPEIRVLGWCPSPPGFHARFSATWREYKYFVLQDGGLDVPAMRAAAAHFVGDHDFRNFCKLDVGAVHSFRRTIHFFDVAPVDGVGGAGGRIYELRVRGSAFLWHQVRCMAAVLLLVGRRLESPDVVARLLDVQAQPCKPQYNMASELPLLLYACGYSQPLPFRRTARAAAETVESLQAMLGGQLVHAAMAGTILQRLAADELVFGPGDDSRPDPQPLPQHPQPQAPVDASAVGAGVPSPSTSAVAVVAPAAPASSSPAEALGAGGTTKLCGYDLVTRVTGASAAAAAAGQQQETSSSSGGGGGAPRRQYVPLLRRPTAPSVESRLARHGFTAAADGQVLPSAAVIAAAAADTAASGGGSGGGGARHDDDGGD